jgi:hypothetical protein
MNLRICGFEDVRIWAKLSPLSNPQILKSSNPGISLD